MLPPRNIALPGAASTMKAGEIEEVADFQRITCIGRHCIRCTGKCGKAVTPGTDAGNPYSWYRLY